MDYQLLIKKHYFCRTLFLSQISLGHLMLILAIRWMRRVLFIPCLKSWYYPTEDEDQGGNLLLSSKL